jgi:hypothetical protein
MLAKKVTSKRLFFSNMSKMHQDALPIFLKLPLHEISSRTRCGSGQRRKRQKLFIAGRNLTTTKIMILKGQCKKTDHTYIHE